MKLAILIGRETAPLHQRDGKRVAQHQHEGRRGRWRQAHRARFARLRQQQRNIRRLQQVEFGVTRDTDQRNRKPFGECDQVGKLAASRLN